MLKKSRLVFSLMLISVMIIYSRDLSIVLPESWNGFVKDTSQLTVAVPHAGCFELETGVKLPIANWKALIVNAVTDVNNANLNNGNTFLADVKLQVIQNFSFNDLTTYEINYEGNKISIMNDTFPTRPILFIANLPENQRVISLYDGRKKENKKIEKQLNSVNYTVTINKKDSSTEICKVTANEKVQILFEGNNTKIIWIGDLNGDNKIDIILKRYGKEGLYSRMDLWLSTKTKDKILDLVSSMYYGGCN